MKKLIVCVATIVLTPAVYSLTAAQKNRETDVVRAVRAAKDSVVNIGTTRIVKGLDEDIFFFFRFPRVVPREVHSLGSGFVIHPAGYIVTNAHVVQQASEITVTLTDKTSLQASKIGADFEHDLAVIKVNPPKPLKALKLGRGDDLMIGETVIAIGNPLGYEHSVTTGVVSAIDRELQFRTGQVYRKLIQTDASINPGNSGGPLLNINGELIGINTAIRGDAQNIGFAINVESLKYLLPKLFDGEHLRRINLGFSVSPMPDARHLRVVSVVAGSPADKAGVTAGDVITALDDRPLTDPVDFYVTLFERPVGRTLVLTVQRDKRFTTLKLPFEEKPLPDGRRLARQRLGLIVVELPDQRLVVVKDVLPRSPGLRAGIEPGDVIDQIGRYSVRSLDHVGQILESVRPGQKIYLAFVRKAGQVYYRFEGYVQTR